MCDYPVNHAEHVAQAEFQMKPPMQWRSNVFENLPRTVPESRDHGPDFELTRKDSSVYVLRTYILIREVSILPKMLERVREA